MVNHRLSYGSGLKARLLARTNVLSSDLCWPWLGGLRSNGYGTFAVQRDGRWSQTTAHRVSYEVFIGPIPEGFEVDHLCNNRACVNPAHLEAITVAENRARRNARKTHCIHGHLYDEANTYWLVDRNGYRCRFCKICERQKVKARRERLEISKEFGETPSTS